MTDRDPRLVDAFLEDLGSAPVPGGLEADVARRIRDERQERRGRPGAWFAWAAVLVVVTTVAGVAWVVAGPGPTPTPPAIHPTGAPLPEPSSSPTLSFFPSASPGASTTPGTSLFRLVDDTIQSDPLPILVDDASGTVIGATVGVVAAIPEAPVGLTQGPDARSIHVQWVGGPCDQLAWVKVDPIVRVVSVSTRTTPANCDAMGLARSVALRFELPVDASAWQGRAATATWKPMLQPAAIAFTETTHGYIGGMDAATGLAVVSETFDGGGTWASESVTWGTVVGLGLDADQNPWAAVSCGDLPDDCAAGVYRRAGMHWTRVLAVDPVRLAVSGPDVAVLVAVPITGGDTVGLPPRQIRRRYASTDSWATLKDPCGGQSSYATAISLDGQSNLVVVCEGQGATGSSRKTIWRSVGDVPGHWETLAAGPEPGTGMAMSLAPDGTGWLWGSRSHLLMTVDGGASWTQPAVSIADGDARIVFGADALGGGSGVTLVWDPDRPATLLLRTADGTTWTEMTAFPSPRF